MKFHCRALHTYVCTHVLSSWSACSTLEYGTNNRTHVFCSCRIMQRLMVWSTSVHTAVLGVAKLMLTASSLKFLSQPSSSKLRLNVLYAKLLPFPAMALKTSILNLRYQPVPFYMPYKTRTAQHTNRWGFSVGCWSDLGMISLQTPHHVAKICIPDSSTKSLQVFLIYFEKKNSYETTGNWAAWRSYLPPFYHLDNSTMVGCSKPLSFIRVVLEAMMFMLTHLSLHPLQLLFQCGTDWKWLVARKGRTNPPRTFH